MKPIEECDETPVVTECPDCGEIFAEDECPYCEPETTERVAKLAVEMRGYAQRLDDVEPEHASALHDFTDRLDELLALLARGEPCQESEFDELGPRLTERRGYAYTPQVTGGEPVGWVRLRDRRVNQARIEASGWYALLQEQPNGVHMVYLTPQEPESREREVDRVLARIMADIPEGETAIPIDTQRREALAFARTHLRLHSKRILTGRDEDE